MKNLLFIVIVLAFLPLSVFAQDDFIAKTKPIDIPDIPLTKEQLFIKEHFPFIPIIDWTIDMPFYAYNTQNKKYIPLKIGEITPEDKYLGRDGQLIHPYIYKFIGIDSPFRISERTTDSTDNIEHSLIGTTLYWIIYVGDIPKARELLIGKSLYILTDDWFVDGDIKPQKDIQSRFVPVIIKNVGIAPNPSYPVKVIFEASDKNEYYVNVKFSGINSGGTSDVPIFSNDFPNTFAFENPKIRYPKISLSKWKLISQRRVTIGMNKDECQLSWGIPLSINRSSGSYGVKEQWVYGDNSYLYFENGKLSSIQN